MIWQDILSFIYDKLSRPSFSVIVRSEWRIVLLSPKLLLSRIYVKSMTLDASSLYSGRVEWVIQVARFNIQS